MILRAPLKILRGENIACRLLGFTRHLTTPVSTSIRPSEGTSSKVKRREWRFLKNQVLRRNRRNHALESKARNGQLLVSLSRVHREWAEHYGKQHLQLTGLHSHIYQDVYGFLFKPSEFMEVKYGQQRDTHTVERGNILTSVQTSLEPKVKLPEMLREKYSTLILSDPDGHLTNGSMELLHWMIVNIPPDKGTNEGTLVIPYLQPVPPRGSGFHRYVFSLYTHTHPLQETTPTGLGLTGKGDWLTQRTFSTRHFLSTHSELEPFAFSFFQSQWDKSVHDVYMTTLASPEPVYHIKKQPTPHQLRQREVKQQRADRYRIM